MNETLTWLVEVCVSTQSYGNGTWGCGWGGGYHVHNVYLAVGSTSQDMNLAAVIKLGKVMAYGRVGGGGGAYGGWW